MSNRPTNFERSWRMLEYLRWNSDSEHTVDWAAIREAFEKNGSDMLKDKDTFKDAVLNMANTLNCDENGSVRPPEQWKLIYQAYLEMHGGVDEEEGDDTAEKETAKPPKRLVSPPVHNLYYRHTFSYEEINALIEGILFSRLLDTQTANRLVHKIEDHLTTIFYKKGPKNVCTVRETVPVDRERLRENLLLIQRAIDDHVKIAFLFNGYNRRKELLPVREEKDAVSPYYIVADGGRYYLLACQEKQRGTGPERRMSIWRIDLMTELEIPGRNERRKGEPALEKRKVEDLPQSWEEKFPFEHLNMAYDKPIPITLRIWNPWPGKDAQPWTNYTFMVDWFGDTFRFVRAEPEGDIVRVKCSPFAMINWALQYADRVEVLEPQNVREAVMEKIKRLNQKYGVEN